MKIKWICGKCGKRRGKANPIRAGWLRFSARKLILIRCPKCVREI